MVEAALQVPVVQHDDNLQGAMHDLQVLHNDRPLAAVEVTAAADATSIELWKLVNESSDRWQVEGLVGGWSVALYPDARAKRIVQDLPVLLAAMEASEVRSIRGRRTATGVFEAALASLRIASADQYGTDYPGSIYVTIKLPHERVGEMVSDSGDPVAKWVGEYLRAPERRDVLSKLHRSGATDRHAFIILPGFTTAPFVVADLFMRSDPPLPTESPDLPPEVTHVWVVSTWTIGRGLRWAPGDGWKAFDKPEERAA